MVDKYELREINRNQIYLFLYRKQEASKQEIAAATNLSIPTVAKNLEELAAKKLVARSGSCESTGGRKAQIFRCCYDAKYSVGIDITKHHLTIVVVDLQGNIVGGGERELFVYSDTPEYYDSVMEKVFGLLNQHGITYEKMLGIGVSLPAIVDRESSILTHNRIIDTPKDMINAFRNRCSFRVEFFNDANAGGYAETWQKESNPVFYLMLSNSVGGAIITPPTVHKGDNSRSAEVGHMRIVPDGNPCYCGQKGCVNAYCSSKILSDLAGGKLARFFEEMEGGNAAFREAFQTYLHYLATTVVNLRMLFDNPVIIGGYAGQYFEPYIEELRELVVQLDPYDDDGAFLKPCVYKKTASAAGAAMYFLNDFIESI